MDSPNFTRRDALKIGVLGAAAVALPVTTALHAGSVSQFDVRSLKPYTTPWSTPPAAVPLPVEQVPAKWKQAVRDNQIDFYRLEQRYADVEVLPGVKTGVFGYNGIAPGPTIRTSRNRKIVVRQVNKLPEKHPGLGYETWTSTHLHGSPSRPQFDGYASDITRPARRATATQPATSAEWKDYEYENHMTARTLWYHDHGVHHTAENAYMGLAAQYHCSDSGADLNGISLPSAYGVNDFPLMISDKALTAFKTVGGQKRADLLFNDNGHSGTFGDIVTCNGRAWPYLEVEPTVYRFRILNASVSRGYRLKLSDGRPMALIGTDAGLTPKVRYLSDFRIGMAERYEVLIDFSNAAGKTINMVNLGVPNSPNYDHTDKVMQFRVKPAVSRVPVSRMPADGATLYPQAPAMDVDLPLTSTVAATRNLELTRTNGEWTVGPYTWREVEESRYTKVFANPQPGTVERWVVQNKSGGWFHPVHIHLVDFRVVKRNGGPPHPWEAGGKDVIYVGENETVELLMRFNPTDHGRYMIHCHNLTHEDHDMMTQFQVGPEVKDSKAMYTDDVPFLAGPDGFAPDPNGTQPACDKDDPILAAHPCADAET